MQTILLVDDDDAILFALKRSLKKLHARCIFADSAEKGLQILQEEEVHIVLSDMIMPKMDGLEFLSIVQEKYPNTIRIVLSGYFKFETIFHSLLNGVARTYIEKPWKKEHLEKVLLDSIELSEFSARTKESRWLKSLGSDFPMPTKYFRLVELIQSGATIDEISSLIEESPELCARVLKYVNSAQYGMDITDLKKAVIYLGLNTVASIILLAESIDENSLDPLVQREVRKLERLSVLRKNIQQEFYKEIYGQDVSPISTIASLLANIGWITKFRIEPMETLQEWRLFCKDKVALFSSLEEPWRRPDHFGAFILNLWNLPMSIVQQTKQFYLPYLDQEFDQSLVVPVLVHEIAFSILEEKPLYVPLEWFEKIGLTQEQLEAWVDGKRKVYHEL